MGPLYVPHGKDDIQCKMYVCLFTGLSTRTMHLELVELDVEPFFRAFRRFCARRGIPRRIFPDNAKIFH